MYGHNLYTAKTGIYGERELELCSYEGEIRTTSRKSHPQSVKIVTICTNAAMYTISKQYLYYTTYENFNPVLYVTLHSLPSPLVSFSLSPFLFLSFSFSLSLPYSSPFSHSHSPNTKKSGETYSLRFPFMLRSAPPSMSSPVCSSNVGCANELIHAWQK